MRIHVKSIPDNWMKESNGTKPNTVRKLDGLDVIEIENSVTRKIIVAKITDITVYRGEIIISFEKDSIVVR